MVNHQCTRRNNMLQCGEESGDPWCEAAEDVRGERQSCLGRTSTGWPMLVRTPASPFTHPCRASWRVLAVVGTLLVMSGVTPCLCLEAQCPSQNDTESYCVCTTEEVRSGIKININCDFMKEDVVVTEKLYPFRESKALSASVLLTNATSLRVTQDFLREWLRILSVGLDLWNCGTVNLAPAPALYLRFPHSFSTFVGISVVGSRVDEVPAGLLRDRVTASLRIQNSVVGVVRSGVMQAVRNVRYIVMENSQVDEVEGSVAAEGSFTLSHTQGYRWNGIILNNVTMRSLGPGSFNLTYQAKDYENIHKVEMKRCRVDVMGRGGISTQGDIAVTLKNNTFGRLEDNALKITVNRDFKFENNVVESAGERALYSLMCNNMTMLDTNMIFIKSERNVNELLSPSFFPFPASCNHSQVFRVVIADVPVLTSFLSTSTWVILAILLLVLVAGSVIFWQWRENNKQESHSPNDFNSYNGIASSARYEAVQQEVNMVENQSSSQVCDRTKL